MTKYQATSRTKLAKCETCHGIFSPRYNSKGRFCSRKCARLGSRGVCHTEIIRLYTSELVGSPTIARRLGCDARTINKIIRSYGLTRPQAESTKIRWDRLSESEKLERTAAAHAAATGRRRKPGESERVARGRDAWQATIGPHERKLAAMLEQRGVSFVQQLAVGQYNTDFALAGNAVFVEISGKGWANKTGHPTPRLECLLNHGHVIDIRMRKGIRVLTAAAVDQLVVWVDELRASPPGIRQYRMVWANGQLPKHTVRSLPSYTHRVPVEPPAP